MSNLTTSWYFGEGYESREDLEEDLEIWDGSRLESMAYCPRQFYYDNILQIRPPVWPRHMKAGSALHHGLDCYYSSDAISEDDAVRLAGEYWEAEVDESIPDTKGKDFLTRGHIETVLKFYFDQWNRNRIETYTPITGYTEDDLNLDDVIAAYWQITPEGHIVFGESSLIMRFYGPDGEPFAYAGKPDLPVRNQSGELYIMDHKASTWYLSDYWAKKKFGDGNKMRGYMAMMQKLLDKPFDGAIINGIYCGDRAASSDFGGTRSSRYPRRYTEASIQEAIHNQYEWIQTIEHYRQRSYWPQGCDACRHPKLCNSDPETRDLVINTEYESGREKFFDY